MIMPMMLTKKCFSIVLFFLSIFASFSHATIRPYGLGQMIQITTSFPHAYHNARWILVIRDVDHHQRIPYSFDMQKGQHQWMVFTYSKHYRILSSTFYADANNKLDQPKPVRIKNFCQLKGHNSILSSRSMHIYINGDVLSDPEAAFCQISTYSDNQLALFKYFSQAPLQLAPPLAEQKTQVIKTEPLHNLFLNESDNVKK